LDEGALRTRYQPAPKATVVPLQVNRGEWQVVRRRADAKWLSVCR